MTGRRRTKAQAGQVRYLALAPDQEARARLAFAQGMRRDEVARLIGVSVSRLWMRLQDQLKDVRVGQGRREARRARHEREPDPTPEQIAERAAAIRATWTPEIEAERRLNFNGPLEGL